MAMVAIPAAAMPATIHGSKTGSPASAARARSTLRQIRTMPGAIEISVPSRKGRNATPDAPTTRLTSENGAIGIRRRPASVQTSDEVAITPILSVIASGTRFISALWKRLPTQ